MRFPTPLLPGRLLRRYKRFLADVVLDGDASTVTAHVPNSGAMIGLAEPGQRVWLSRSTNHKRRLAFTLELVEADGTLVGVNTQHPNALVAAAVAAGTIAELAGYLHLRREVRYGHGSRVDLVLAADDGRPPCYVEVKNVHLRRPERWHGRAAEFPDCVTARGARHARELAGVAATGARAVLLFLVQRADCDQVRIAADLDPTYALAVQTAVGAGIELVAYRCALTPAGIEVTSRVPVLEPAAADWP